MQNEKRLSKLNDKLLEYQKTKDFLASTLKHDFINSIEGDIKFLANLMLDSIQKARTASDMEKSSLFDSLNSLEGTVREISQSGTLPCTDLKNVRRQVSNLLSRTSDWNGLTEVHEGAKILTKRMIFLLDQLISLIREIGALNEPNFKKIAFHDFQKEYRQNYEKIYEEQALKNGIRLEWNLDVQVNIRFDSNHLTRIWNNLISNAIKYSPNGGTVSIKSRMMGTLLEIAVSDNGIGILKEDIVNVFKSGFRSRNAEDSGIPGTGTGLGYVSYILERCGGTISLESPGRDGASSTFALCLPIYKKDSKETTSRKGRILVLGQNNTMRDIAEKIRMMSGRTVERFEIVNMENEELAGITETMKNFGTLLYRGNNEDKMAVCNWDCFQKSF